MWTDVGGKHSIKENRKGFLFFLFFVNFVSELGLIPRGVTPRVSYRMKLAQKKPTVTWCRLRKQSQFVLVYYIYTHPWAGNAGEGYQNIGDF